MKVHQILITDSNKLPSTFPDKTQLCLDSVTRYLGTDRHIYSGEELEQILYEFDKKVFYAYKKLNSYSIRSDIARMVLLYLNGGLYSDIHLRFNQPLFENRMNEYDLYGFLPLSHYFSFGYAVHNGLMYAKAGCKILERAIEFAVVHCRNEFYGADLTQIAGQLCIGHAYYNCVMEGVDSKLKVIGETVNLLANSYSRHPYLFGLSSYEDGLIATFEKPADMRATGIAGTNCHFDLYRNGKMYNDTQVPLDL